MNIEDFYEKIVFFYPEVKEKIEEHIDEFNEPLDTVIFEDIIWPHILFDLKKDDNNRLVDLFDYFELVSNEADEYLLNVFTVTLLEELGNEEIILKKAKMFMGCMTEKLQKGADISIGRIAR